jgi:hypothetical protein
MFTTENIKQFVEDLHKTEIEVISFVDRTTVEAGHFAQVTFKHVETGLRNEITVLKADFLSWFKSKAESVSQEIETVSEKVLEASKEGLNDSIQAIVDVVVQQNDDKDTPTIGEAVINTASQFVKAGIDNSTAAPAVKQVLDVVVDSTANAAKDKLKK